MAVIKATFVATKGLTRAQTLQALYDHARAHQFRDHPAYINTLSKEAAAEEVKLSTAEKAKYRFDYVRGTPLGLDLSNASGFYADTYDNTYGRGAAQAVI